MPLLAVIEEVFRALGGAHASSVSSILSRVGSLCGSTALELAEGDSHESVAALSKAAERALGAAIGSMGPAAVLEILPLDLEVKPSSATLCYSLKSFPSPGC